MPVDASSIFELAVAFNFAYGFIRGLSTNALDRRIEKRDELIEVADDLFSEKQEQLNECNRQKDNFSVSIDGAKDRIKRQSLIGLIYSFFIGFFALLVLFNSSFGWLAISADWTLGIAIFVILNPFLTALALWIVACHTLRGADESLDALQELVTASNTGST